MKNTVVNSSQGTRPLSDPHNQEQRPPSGNQTNKAQSFRNSSAISARLKYGFGRQAKLLLIGLDNAGKSTLMDRLASGRLIQHPPTDQARSKELRLGNITFTAYDLGGHIQARRVWRDYFPAVDGIVFLVDAADSARFQESSIELDSILHDETISHVPIVVLGNKNDRREAVEEEKLSDILGMTIYRTGKDTNTQLDGRPFELFMCSVLKQQGYGTAFRWLANHVK